MGSSGCYSLILTCDYPDCFSENSSIFSDEFEFIGFNFAGAVREARKSGWLVSWKKCEEDEWPHIGRYCLCPEHSGKL